MPGSRRVQAKRTTRRLDQWAARAFGIPLERFAAVAPKLWTASATESYGWNTVRRCAIDSTRQLRDVSRASRRSPPPWTWPCPRI